MNSSTENDAGEKSLRAIWKVHALCAKLFRMGWHTHTPRRVLLIKEFYKRTSHRWRGVLLLKVCVANLILLCVFISLQTHDKKTFAILKNRSCFFIGGMIKIHPCIFIMLQIFPRCDKICDFVPPARPLTRSFYRSFTKELRIYSAAFFCSKFALQTLVSIARSHFIANARQKATHDFEKSLAAFY